MSFLLFAPTWARLSWNDKAFGEQTGFQVWTGYIKPTFDLSTIREMQKDSAPFVFQSQAEFTFKEQENRTYRAKSLLWSVLCMGAMAVMGVVTLLVRKYFIGLFILAAIISALGIFYFFGTIADGLPVQNQLDTSKAVFHLAFNEMSKNWLAPSETMGTISTSMDKYAVRNTAVPYVSFIMLCLACASNVGLFCFSKKARLFDCGKMNTTSSA